MVTPRGFFISKLIFPVALSGVVLLLNMEIENSLWKRLSNCTSNVSLPWLLGLMLFVSLFMSKVA
jgi:uncharacterized iron-regulated membrane protein